MKNFIKATAFTSSLLALSSTGLLAVVNFEIQNSPTDDKELLPGVTYNDGGATFQFGVDVDGLTNGLDRGSNTYANMFIEEVGTDAVNGFQQGIPATSTVFDNDIDPLNNLDSYFLRTNGFSGSSPLDGAGLFVIEYVGLGVTGANGEIWDIDGEGSLASEIFLVQAWHDNGTSLVEVANVRSDDPVISGGSGWSGEDLSGDGLAWTFAVSSIAAFPINYITIDFVGTKNQFIGLAFDNFNATQVPEPGLFGLISGIFAMGWVMCRRRSA